MTSSPPGDRPLDPSAPEGTPAPEAPAAGLDEAALGRLRELDPDGRHGVVGRMAHTLKSSSASVGALALAAACAEVEARIRTGAEGELSTDVERLLAEGQAALASVEAMLRPNAKS